MIKKNILTRIFFPHSKELVFIFFFYLVLILGTAFFRDGDPGRHITFGQYIINTRHMPTEDIFTYTTKGIYLPLYEWLSQIIFGASYNLLGLSGVVVVSALLIASMLTLTYQEFLRRHLPALAAFILVSWLGILTMVHWAARPHLFSLLFIAIISSWLAQLAEGKKIPIWWFPLLMMIWVNIHGAAFPLIFLLWISYIIGNIWDSWQNNNPTWNPILKNLLLTGALSILATFINPSGWRLWEFVFSFVSNKYLLEVAAETRSVNFHGFNSYPFLITIMSSLFILSKSQQKRPIAESFLLAGWTALALYGYRNIPIYGLITFPILAEHLRPFANNITWIMRPSQFIKQLEKDLYGFLSATIFCLVCVVSLSHGVKFDYQQDGYNFSKSEFPVNAVNWLEKNPQSGYMFNYFPWGGYLILRIWPEYLMFIDGQMIYVETLVHDYYQIINAEDGWENTIKYYEIDWVLVPNNMRIVHELKSSKKWLILYSDDIATIFRQQNNGDRDP